MKTQTHEQWLKSWAEDNGVPEHLAERMYWFMCTMYGTLHTRRIPAARLERIIKGAKPDGGMAVFIAVCDLLGLDKKKMLSLIQGRRKPFGLTTQPK